MMATTDKHQHVARGRSIGLDKVDFTPEEIEAILKFAQAADNAKAKPHRKPSALRTVESLDRLLS